MDDHASLGDGTDYSKKRRLLDHLLQEIDPAWADLTLLMLCFLTGIVDSAVFKEWDCFVSMQTGNTIYVGLAAAGETLNRPYRWAKSGIAILGFCLGVYCFSFVSRRLGELKRSTICCSLGVQAIICIGAAIMVQTDVVPRGAGEMLPKNCIVLAPLSLLSFQSAGQIVISRFLAYTEIPTLVLTNAYCDLFMDPMLFFAPITQDVERNRRALSAVTMLAGAALGAFLTRSGSTAIALWVVAAGKIVLVGVWLVWPGRTPIRLE
ncbi:uncharacterized protein AB675_8194 [Cyphellophora attinorum]|uniref:DUF1275 domain protein n=1 Tax=Cyphellophora attinorum TaxID=1664694 RepID=A0A0N1HAU6_9EURO|nr:uncharacterized protein AB675_8194 [Phialophora attinorum]KPI41053.1 hypothetical protein AB675_8194 [Phialophora attinorum]